VIQQAPDDQKAWRSLALTQLAVGQRDAYRQTCLEMLQRFAGPPRPVEVGLVFVGAPGNVLGGPVLATWAGKAMGGRDWHRAVLVRTCLLRPGARADTTALLPVAPNDFDARAVTLCRAGRYAEAVQLLAGRTQDPLAALYLALAEKGRGRSAEARRALQEA